MKNLKVEEFEFFQYFENEMGKNENAVEENENDQELPPAKAETNIAAETNVVSLIPSESKEEAAETEIAQQNQPAMPDELVSSLLREAEQQANALMTKAALDASEIVNLAKERAEEIENEARKSGYDQGFTEGKQAAVKATEDEQRTILEERYSQLLEGMYTGALDIEMQKEACVKRYLKDLSLLALTVAEKVINISLKSSGEIIERMIRSTVETSGTHQWAKIRISAADEKLLKEAGVDLEEAISHVADRVKIVVIDDAPMGTCYVEFPDQIIDASVQTQLQNIHEMAEELQL